MRRSGRKASAHKDAHDALRHSRDLLHRVVMGAPIVLWSVDTKGIFTLSEGRGLTSLGLAPGEVVGKSVFDVYRDYPAITGGLRRCLDSGEEVVYLAHVAEGVFDTRITPILAGKKVTGAVGVSIDVTDRTRMEIAMRGLSRRLFSIQEEERRNIARELHDEAGQAMTALKLRLDLARRETEPERIRAQIDMAATLAGDVLSELRRIAYDLRPGALDELGLVPAVRALVADFRARTGILVDLVEPSSAARGDRDCEATVFRFLQERLDDVARHGRPKSVAIALSCDHDRARATIDADGAGPPLAPESFELSVHRERARLLGGELVVQAKEGGGAILVLDVPLRLTAESDA